MRLPAQWRELPIVQKAMTPTMNCPFCDWTRPDLPDNNARSQMVNHLVVCHTTAIEACRSEHVRLQPQQ